MTKFIINIKSGKVWSCDKVGNDYLIYRNNQSKFISKKSLKNNWKELKLTKNN